MSSKKRSLTNHEVMRKAVGYAYAVGIMDYKRGRNTSRTGSAILQLILDHTKWNGVFIKEPHLRYLKSAYQAAKFNCRCADFGEK